MCDCFHLAFPNWHDTSSGTGAGRRLRGPDPGGPDDSVCEEPSQYTEGERPRPQGSSPVDEYPETERFSDSDKEFETDRHSKKKEKKNRKSGFGYMFEKSSTPKMSKLKEAQSPDSGVIVKTAKDGCAEGLIYGGGGKEGIFIKEVVPESPASKSLRLREGDQILSATVYFDNVPYEDAVQILEHAQAYNVKLCLKRKPEITGAETTVESDVIPEDGSYNLEMRDKEKTKRRGDARISWPKFPTLGKGRKSHFKRSHSSSEADEQRKLELSPTTSDTESPVKSQDVLKGKKRNKMKLSSLTKTSRVSSSDGQDTDAPITGYDIETQELPVSLESPSKEIEGRGVDLDDSRQVIPRSPDKVELISTDTTLKSDLPSPTKSPDGKKKKKEKSELKIKLLGKDKSSKGKASPKRLKTLGASLDISERPKTEESDGTKSVDAGMVEQDSRKDQPDLSSIALLEESPQKSKEKTKKKRSKDKASPKFKLPKIGFVDYTVEQKTMTADDQGCVTTQPGESKDELYGSLSKDGFSRTQLPKREEIEIPGMEDVSRKRLNGNGETLQLSIDVNSVKEAVSKLPGYKLPQVDPDGVLIPEEIIVIDANAQRISVKSPTKVMDSSAKKDSKPDTLSRDVTSLDPTNETKNQETQDMKSRKTKKVLAGFGIPKLDLSFTDFSVVQKQSLSVKSESTGVLQEETTFNKDIKVSNLETLPLKSHNGVDIPTDGIEYIDSAGSPDKEDQRTGLVTGIDVEADCGNAGVERTDTLPKFGDNKADAEAVQKVAIKTPDKQEKGGLFKMPTFSISMPKFTGSGVDSSKSSAVLPEAQVEVKSNQNNIIAEQKLEIRMPTMEIKKQKNANELGEQNGEFKKPVVDITIPKSEVSGETVPKTENREQSAEVGIKSPDVKIEAKSATDSPSKFWMPKFKLPRFDVGFREVDTGVTINGSDINTEAKGDVDIVTSTVDVKGVSLDEKIKGKDDGQESKAKMPDLSSSMQLTKDVEVKVPEEKRLELEVEVPTLGIDGKDSEMKLEGQGAKFKMPKFKMPKFGIGTATVSAEVPNVDTDVKVISSDLNIPATDKDLNIVSTTIDIDDSVTEIGGEDGKGSKFTMPNLGLSMPTVRKPKIDLSLSGDDAELHLRKAATEVEGSVNIDVSTEQRVNVPKVEAEVKLPDVQIAADSKPADGQVDGRGGKFKIPKFGIRMPKVEVAEKEVRPSQKDSDVTLAKSEAKTKAIDFEPKDLDVDVNIKSPEIAIGAKNVDDSSRFKMPKFKLPKVGGGSATASIEVYDVDTDVQMKGADINIPEDEAVIDLVTPQVKVDAPSVELKTTGSVEGGKGSKFRMPHLGISVPKVKGPKIDLKVSDCKVDTEISETGETLMHQDILIPEQNVNIPEIDVEVKLPEDHHIDGDDKRSDKEVDGHGGKFKLPKFGMKMPKVKAPGIALTLPSKETEETSTEVELEVPEAALEETSVHVEIKPPEVVIAAKSSDESPSKYKMKKFKLPKFGAKASTGKTHAGVEPIKSELEVDVNLTDKDLNVVAPEVTIKIPHSSEFQADLGKLDVSIPAASGQKTDGDSKGGFKMPALGITMPKLKGAEVELSKKTDVSVPGAKASVELTDVRPIEPIPTVGLKVDVQEGVKTTTKDLEEPKMEIDLERKTLETPELGAKDVHGTVEIEGSRFKMPKFGFSKPKFKVPEIDLSINKTGVEVENKVQDVDATLTAEIICPEVKTEVTIPDAEIKVPEAEVEIKALENDNPPENLNESPAKFKLPSFKFPKFGASTKVKVDVQVPELEADFQKEAPNLTGGKQEDVDFEIQMPKADLEASKPEIDLSQLKYDVPKTSLEVKGQEGEDLPSPDLEMKAPELNIRVQTAEGSPSKFWLPSFKLPKFGFGVVTSSSTTVPDKEHGVIIDSQEEVVEIVLDKGQPFIDIKTEEDKEHMDVTLPSVQAIIEPLCVDVKGSVKDENVSSEINVPTKDTKGYQSKFKMPSFKVPKLGIGTPSATIEVPDVEKSLKIDGHEVVSIAAPALDVEMPRLELEGKNTELTNLGLSISEVKGPAFDISAPKQDVSGTIPTVEADVQLPVVETKDISATVELKSPEVKAVDKTAKGSPSKFKMPSFKLPRIGIGSQQVTLDASGPSVDAELECKTNIESARLEQESGKIKVELPQVEMKSPDVRTSSKDVDVALPAVTAEVQLPDVKLESPAKVELKSSDLKGELKGSPSKFKMPAFKIPKFGVGFSSGSVETPDADNVKIDDKEEVLQVSIDIPQSDISLETKQQKGIDVNLPKLRTSVPEGKDADIDLNVSNKEVDINLSAIGVDVQLPDIELKESHKVEVKSPEKKAVTVDAKGSPSKFKMPSFKLPKFGISAPSATVEPPDVDSSLIIDETKEVGSVSIVLPDSSMIPSMEVQMTGPEVEGKEIKIEPGEVQLPQTEVKDSSATVDFKPPEIKVATKGSASKFKMPSFKLPKIGVGAPSGRAVEEPEIDKSIRGNEEISGQISFETPGFDQEVKEVDFQLPTMAISGPEVKGPHLDIDPSKKGQVESVVKVDVKSPEVKAVLKEEKGSPSKFKMPSLKLPRIGLGSATVAAPEVDPSLKTHDSEEVIGVSIVAPRSVACSSVGIDISGPQLEGKEVKMEQPNVNIFVPHVDVTLPKVKAGVDSETKEAKVEMASTDIKAATKDPKASPSKFKMPVFKLPKIGIGSSSATAEVPEVDSGLKIEGEAVGVSITSPSFTAESTKIDHEGKGIQIGLKGPAVDPLNKEVNVSLPSIKSDIQLKDTGLKESQVEFEIPGVKAVTKEAKGSPSKFKMPSLKLPKFGSQSVAVEVNKGNADVVVGPIDEEHDRKQMEVQLPDIDASAPKVGGADVDISLLHENVDVSLPKIEAEFSHEIKPPTLDIATDKAQDSSSDGTPATNLEDKIKKSKFSFPKFSFSKQTSKDFQVNVSQPTVDVLIAEGKVEVIEPPAEVKLVDSGAEGEGKDGKFKMPKFGISLTKPKSSESDLALSKTDDSAALPKVEVIGQDVKEKVEINTQAKGSDKEGTGSKFKIPSFGFSVQGGDNDGGLSTKEIQLPELEVKEKLSEDEMEPSKMSAAEQDKPEVEVDGKLKRSNWTFPKFSFSRSGGKPDDVSRESATGDLAASKTKVDESKSCVEFSHIDEISKDDETVIQPPELSMSLPEGEGAFKDVLTTAEAALDLKTSEVEQPLTPTETKAIETPTEAKDAGGSPFKFKLPSLKMSLFRSQATETSTIDNSETKVEEANLEENISVTESPVVEHEEDTSKPEMSVAEETKTEDAPASPVSPSRFQLPLFKMPTLGFSRAQPEEEYISVESKNDQLEIKVESKSPKSPKSALASVGDMMQNLTIDVSKGDGEHAQTTNGTLEKQVEAKVKPIEAIQESPKRSDWGGWFKFPTFGLSSPSEQRKSPAKENVDEEVSPTSSVQSSDAFADVSSTVTSEPTGLSPSSPTKVTVKYTDPDDKIHSSITASTKRTQVISVEPMMAEKITNLSSGVSSSSEDTLRLESGKIHLLTSNIQATPESHHTKLVTYVHDQSEGGFTVETEAGGPRSPERLWTGKIGFEKQVIQKQSSESRETVVITKQITRVLNPAAEPITHETATSIRQLKETVHSEKMRFFDKAKK